MKKKTKKKMKMKKAEKPPERISLARIHAIIALYFRL